MKLLIVVASWLIPLGLYRADKRRADNIHNLHLSLGRKHKNLADRNRQWQAKKAAAIGWLAVAMLFDIVCFHFMAHTGMEGVLTVVALGSFLGGGSWALVERTAYEVLDGLATNRAVKGKNDGWIDSTEVLGKNGQYVRSIPEMEIGSEHGSAHRESPETSDMADPEGIEPARKAGA